MCIALLAKDVHPRYPLILLANRDEDFARPTRRMSVWETQPRLLAGKDLVGGGTWLGLNEAGQIALLTNYREPFRSQFASSRGRLILDFLLDRTPGFEDYLQATREDFAGYNLIYGSFQKLRHFSNRDSKSTALSSGIHGLSNALLNTPWPKVERGKGLLAQALRAPDNLPESLFRILRDSFRPPDSELPQTGVSLEAERALSSVFISPQNGYGSRSATVVLTDSSGTSRVWERDYLGGQELYFQWP
ncbi:MAG TPA: NRDE family protein [Phycisphaerales bacterium]|nr:NRDE family protein [Phycisphaerales bacterium]